jgi:hypothetical protein
MLTSMRVLLAFVSVSVLCATGCFIDPNKLNDMGDGGGDGDASTDMAIPGDGGPLGDNGSVTVEKTGAVVVAQFQSVATTGTSAQPLHVVSAGFYDTVATPCALTTMGACTLQKCANTAPTTTNNAGIITVTGGAPGTTTLNPSGDSYTPIMMNSLYWSAAATLSVTASGGDVPASSTSVMTPSLITVSNPPAPNQDMLGPPMAILRSTDLQLSWSGGSAGSDVEFTLSSLPGDYLAKCKFPAGNGAGTVPSAILTQMFDDGVTTARITATSIAASNIMAGEFKIGFLAINTASYTVTIDIE